MIVVVYSIHVLYSVSLMTKMIALLRILIRFMVILYAFLILETPTA